MATEDQFLNAQRGSGSRTMSAVVVPMTMAAGATVSTSCTLPDGSWVSAIKFETATAISGSPTNINCRVGTAAAGQQVVADVDCKAQGHVAATLVAGYDVQGANSGTLYFQAAATGGTNPAGTINAIVHYFAPAH